MRCTGNRTPLQNLQPAPWLRVPAGRRRRAAMPGSALAAGLALLVSLVATPAAAVERFDEVRHYIETQLVEKSVPSITVAVAQEGRIVWEQGFGWADRERRIAATADTVYSLASISKPMTATGLMTLVQAGKVDLDSPVNRYLGAAKLRARVGDADLATVRRVADHTSGLPQYVQFFYSDEPYARPSMDETILRYGNLMVAPGSVRTYSNLGYGVLDYVIERVSGQSYGQFMRQSVFMPLGMTRTSVDIGPGLDAYAATRYGSDGLPVPFYGFDHPGASAVFSSARDLVRFGMFHLKAHLPDQRAILDDRGIDDMHRRTAGDEDNGYGLGFDVSRRHGSLVVSHGGNMNGVNTVLQLFPAQKLAIVVLSNANTPVPAAVADLIAKLLVPNWQLAEKWQPPPARPFVPPPSLLGTWRGTLETYAGELPVALVFLPGGDVHATVGAQLPTLVSEARLEEGTFTGQLMAQLGTTDTERAPYRVMLALRLHDSAPAGEAGEVRLAGSASAFAIQPPRPYFALPHWLELTKMSALATARPVIAERVP